MGLNSQNLKHPHVSGSRDGGGYKGEEKQNEDVQQSGESLRAMSFPSTNPEDSGGKRAQLPPCVSSTHNSPTSRVAFGLNSKGVCGAGGPKQESGETSGRRKVRSNKPSASTVNH